MFFDSLPIETKALLIGLAMALFFGFWAYHDLKKRASGRERIVRSLGVGIFILSCSATAGYAAPHVNERIETVSKQMAEEIVASIDCQV